MSGVTAAVPSPAAPAASAACRAACARALGSAAGSFCSSSTKARYSGSAPARCRLSRLAAALRKLEHLTILKIEAEQ
jgi:hypothetical protein